MWWDHLEDRKFSYSVTKLYKSDLPWESALLSAYIILSIVQSPHNVFLHRKTVPHCKDKIPKFRNKYFQKRNIGVSVPISTFMCLGVMYISPQSVCLFCWRKYVDRSWDYINRSQTHECGNRGWGRAIPRRGIHKWDFPCSARRGHHYGETWPGFSQSSTKASETEISRPGFEHPTSCTVTLAKSYHYSLLWLFGTSTVYKRPYRVPF